MEVYVVKNPTCFSRWSVSSNPVFEQRIEMVMNKLMEYEKSLGTYNKTDKAFKLEKESLDKILNEIVYDHK